jgi:YVTN family beta-propeller protein
VSEFKSPVPTRPAPTLSRRACLAFLALAPACSRRKPGKGFAGYAFVANSAGGAVAVVDLTALAVVRHIRLDGNPHQVLTRADADGVIAVLPAEAEVVKIDTTRLAVQAKRKLPVTPGYAALEPASERLWLLAAGAPRIVALTASALRLERIVDLPHEGVDFDFGPPQSSAAGLIAISTGDFGEVLLLRAASGRIEHRVKIGGQLGSLRFRSDGRHLLIANRSAREIAIHDLEYNRLVVRLPLSVQPDHLVMKDDGGQLFIAGAGTDAVVTVYPYQTEIGSFTLAGRAPGFMTTSRAPDYLFVANPQSNNVTIVNIATQKVIAVAPVGKQPCFVAVTPNSEYALVLSRDSGDMAVLHIGSMAARRSKSVPVLTMIPVGSEPVSAVVRGA